jgi:hypothetical protein
LGGLKLLTGREERRFNAIKVSPSPFRNPLELWNHYVVPQFTFDQFRTARWDRFSHPNPMSKYGMPDFPAIWWWDQAKAARAGSRP